MKNQIRMDFSSYINLSVHPTPRIRQYVRLSIITYHLNPLSTYSIVHSMFVNPKQLIDKFYLNFLSYYLSSLLNLIMVVDFLYL